MNNKRISILIEQARNEDPKKAKLISADDPQMEKFFENIIAIQNIQKMEPEIIYKNWFSRNWKEYQSARTKYKGIIAMGSILNLALYELYLKPGSKHTYQFVKWFFKEVVGKNLGLMKGLKLPDLEGTMARGTADRWKTLQSRIDTVNLKLDDPNKPGYLKFIDGTKKWLSQGGTGARIINGARVAKIMTSLAGLLYYSLVSKNSESTPDSIITTVEDKSVDVSYEWFTIGWNYLKLLMMMEFFWVDTKLTPYLATKAAKDGGDPNASMTIMILGSVLGGTAIKQLFFTVPRFVIRGRKVITPAQAGKIFDRTITNSIRGGVGTFIEDLSVGAQKAVDEIFENLPKKQKNVLSSLDEDFVNRLRREIKAAVNESITNSAENLEAKEIFNNLVGRLTNEIKSASSLTSDATKGDMTKQDVADVVNTIVISCYQGVNRGVDVALSRASRRSERAARQMQGAAGDIVQEAKKANFSSVPAEEGALALKDNNVWDELVRARRKGYNAAVKDLLDECRAIDEEFTTYYYLSGAGTHRGLNAIGTSTSLNPVSYNKNAFTQYNAARETILNNFNNKINKLNEEITERVVDSARAEGGNVDAAKATLRDIELEDFKNIKEVQDFINKTYTDISSKARSTHEGARNEATLLSDASNQLKTDLKDKIDELQEQIVAQQSKVADKAPKRRAVVDVDSDEISELEEALARLNILTGDVRNLEKQHTFQVSLNNFINSVSRDHDVRRLMKETIEDLHNNGVPGATRLAAPAGAGGRAAMLAEMSPVEKIAYLSGIFGTGYLTVKSYSHFSQKLDFKEESPISVSGATIADLVDDDELFRQVIRMLTYKNKNEYAGLEDKKLQRVIAKNFTKLAKASGLWIAATANNETKLASFIKEENTNKASVSTAIQNIKNKINDSTGPSGLGANSGVMAGYLSSKTTDRRRKTLTPQLIKGIEISLLVLAYANQQSSKFKVLEAGDALKDGTKTHIWCTQIDNVLLRDVVRNTKTQMQRLDENRKRIEEVQVTGSGNGVIMPTGGRKWLSDIVATMLKEYRALDNYNQYPYHSEVGSSEEEQRDFIEDWKDFELSLVRDESKEKAIELAKVLIRDLELFGDVVDLVGKNQSVGAEILKKLKNNQEKEQ